MVEVLHVYKEVEIINAELLEGTLKEPAKVTISYDEKPGIQALARTSPDRAPAPNQYASHLRDYEYERLGTVSLLAGLDLHTGRVTEVVRDRHASAELDDYVGRYCDAKNEKANWLGRNLLPSLGARRQTHCCPERRQREADALRRGHGTMACGAHEPAADWIHELVAG